MSGNTQRSWPFGRPLAHARGSVLACLLASCARSGEAGTELPAADAADGSWQDASSEPEADVAVHDVSAEVEAADATAEPVDFCALLDAQPEAQPEPCTPGAIDKQWCGACGLRQRKCDTGGTWKPWSDCLEDELAECIPCESHAVGCGYCGTRMQRCDISQQLCRWALQECVASGVCSPGDFSADTTGCLGGAAHVRWCQAGCSWSQPSDCLTPPTWLVASGSPLAARTGFATAALGDGWLLWGGIGASGALSDGATYHFASDQWIALPAAQWQDGEAGTASFSARAHPAVTVAGDEGVFLWGGDDGATPLGGGARYGLSGEWSGVSDVDEPSARTGATALWDAAAGRVLVWGGTNAYGAAAKGGARYAMANDTWSAMADAPFEPRAGQSAVWDATRGRMVVWGGIADGSSFPERGGAAYDPEMDTWSAIADAPIRRAGHVAVWDADHDCMLVMFGEDGVWDGPRGSGAIWSPGTNSWSLASDLSITGYPLARGYATTFADGTLWVTGGEGAMDGQHTARGARYQVGQDAWSRVPEMHDVRAGHAMGWLGRPLVWGGMGASGSWLASGEVLWFMK